MRLTRIAGGWALAALLAAPGMASAAWNNVFQLTCCGSPAPRTSARVAYAAPAPCATCPQPCQSCAPPCPQTAYMQRSYYQPVTTYKPVASCEPVTSYRTSYYYEPVQTMTYSMYVDPCTGCASQVATPQTSYQMKSKCDAVTSYVQRISYQPVTAYRQSFYYEPVQVQVNPCAGATMAASPYVPIIAAPAAPPVTMHAPEVTESTVAPSSPPPPLNLGGTDNRSMPANPPSDRGVTPSTAAPRGVRFDHFASRTTSPVVGTVVKPDFRPMANAKLQFVDADGRLSQPVTADAAGRFTVTLASGQWKIFTEDAAGHPVYHSDLQVRGEGRNVMVVSR